MGKGHGCVGLGIAEQNTGLGGDFVGIRANQFYRAGLNRFRALGGVAHHQNRFSQRRRFFLDAARIGQD